jgi:hypothetical protein
MQQSIGYFSERYETLVLDIHSIRTLYHIGPTLPVDH